MSHGKNYKNQLIFSWLHFSASTLLTGRASSLQKNLGVDCWFVVTIWLELCTPYSSSCHHHFHHLASVKSGTG